MNTGVSGQLLSQQVLWTRGDVVVTVVFSFVFRKADLRFLACADAGR